jgi:hypothetical protein
MLQAQGQSNELIKIVNFVSYLVVDIQVDWKIPNQRFETAKKLAKNTKEVCV